MHVTVRLEEVWYNTISYELVLSSKNGLRTDQRFFARNGSLAVRKIQFYSRKYFSFFNVGIVRIFCRLARMWKLRTLISRLRERGPAPPTPPPLLSIPLVGT